MAFTIGVLYYGTVWPNTPQYSTVPISRGHSQGLPKIFRTPIHMAHRAVIFATAQLSCFSLRHLLSDIHRVSEKKKAELSLR